MNAPPVHTGKWTDWSGDVGLRDYWTMTVSNTLLLVGGTSTLVTLAGGGLWSITAFLLHYIQARKPALDVVDLQHRIVYRNDTTPVAAIMDAFWIYWSWKPWYMSKSWKILQRRPKRADGVFLRTVRLMLLAASVFFGFVVFGILVAKIPEPAYTYSEVLIESSFKRGLCGIPLFEQTIQANGKFDLRQAQDTRAAVSYSRNCYSPTNNSLEISPCQFFANTTLSYTRDATTCPFGDKSIPFDQSLCSYNGNKVAYRLTTVPLDSHEDFGINARKLDRINFLTRMICSPLSQDGYISPADQNSAQQNSTVRVTNYNYGPSPNIENYTYQYNPASRYANVPFSLTTYYHNATGYSSWIPVPPLSLNDSDFTIIFIAHNSMQYRNSVIDPVFKATYANNISTSTPERFLAYFSDDPVAVVGCAEQYQLCNPNQPSPSQCTPWTDRTSLPLSLETLALNSAQTVTATRFIYMISWANLWSAVNGLGPNALRMYDTAYDYIIDDIPPNQWQLEVQGWFETILAKWQAYTTSFAHYYTDLGPYGHLDFPVLPDSNGAISNELKEQLQSIYESQCANQRIRSTGSYQNVSIMKFSLIWAICGLIWLVSLFLSATVAWIQEHSARKPHTREDPRRKQIRLAYRGDGKLQLHRMALRDALADYMPLICEDGDVPVFETSPHGELPFVLEEERHIGPVYVRRDGMPGYELVGRHTVAQIAVKTHPPPGTETQTSEDRGDSNGDHGEDRDAGRDNERHSDQDGGADSDKDDDREDHRDGDMDSGNRNDGRGCDNYSNGERSADDEDESSQVGISIEGDSEQRILDTGIHPPRRDGM